MPATWQSSSLSLAGCIRLLSPVCHTALHALLHVLITPWTAQLQLDTADLRPGGLRGQAARSAAAGQAAALCSEGMMKVLLPLPWVGAVVLLSTTNQTPHAAHAGQEGESAKQKSYTSTVLAASGRSQTTLSALCTSEEELVLTQTTPTRVAHRCA